jgi:glycosyltransferase involved in cell wall biosynthesis
MHIGIAGPVSIQKIAQETGVASAGALRGLGGTSITRMILGLWQRGHQLSVFTLDCDMPSDKLSILSGERIKLYIGRFRSRHRMRDFFYEECKILEQAMRKDDVPFINAHWTYEYAIAAIKCGKPHIITCRDNPIAILRYMPGLYRLGRLLMAWWVFRNGQYFSTISPYMKKVLSFWDISPQCVIPNTLDKVWFSHQLPSSDRVPRIVAINNGWSERKNMKRAFRAFQIVHKSHPEIELDAYGFDYGYNEVAHQWAKTHGLADGVNFLGFASSDDLRRHLPEYRLLLHPSLEESFGNIIIEGMVSGTPVVGGKFSGAVPWLLGHGKYGVLVNVKDPVDIARGMERILNDPAFAERLSKKAYTYVAENYSPDIVIGKYENVFRSLF